MERIEDTPKTWRELAEAAIADLRRYAMDAEPTRRLVSANAYDAALSALEAEGGTARKCATEGCGNQATVHFERGGVGSDYCGPCYLKIQAIPHVTPPALGGNHAE